jgi:hypothetical protein
MIEVDGDAESGWLTLAKDARDPLHAVPLRQLQASMGGAFDPRPRHIGNQYTTQFGSHSSSSSPALVGDGRMDVFFAGGTHTWDQLSVFVVTAGTRTGRVALYELDDDTLLPTALLYDAGTFTYVGGGVRNLPITPALQTTATWLGLAMILETAGTGAVTSTTSNNDSGSRNMMLFGTNTVDSPITFCVNVLYCATGVAGAPAPGAWSVPPATPQTHDGGVYIRKSA